MEDVIPTELKCPFCQGMFVITGLALDEDQSIYCKCGHCGKKVQFAKVEHHELKSTPTKKK